MHTNGRRISLVFWFAFLWLYAAGAHAWGGFGHRVSAYVAESLLTERTRQAMQHLLGADTLADASVFMDEQRRSLEQRWPESARWHYDNRPVCADSKPYCADQACATGQIEFFRTILKNKKEPDSERSLALKLLVHMLGDLHQPLHMADNGDRGGNDIEVRLHQHAYRLHEVFDTRLIKELAGKQSAKRFSGMLMRTYGSQFKTWQHGTLANWAAETHRLAVEQTYGGLPQFACNVHERRVLDLPDDYLQNARAYLPAQLAKAGVRIAAVLNDSLD